MFNTSKFSVTIYGKFSERSGNRTSHICKDFGVERIPDLFFKVKCRSGADTGFRNCCKLSEQSGYRIKKLLQNVGAERISDSVFKKNVGAERIPDF